VLTDSMYSKIITGLKCQSAHSFSAIANANALISKYPGMLNGCMVYVFPLPQIDLALNVRDG